jgi:hypothetical protein
VVIQFGILVVENYVPQYQWHFHKTSNTTKITCSTVAYVDGVARCLAFIK